jgi:hypothetical protein
MQRITPAQVLAAVHKVFEECKEKSEGLA